MSTRKGHYMHANMLDSQLATLERPAYALRLSIEGSVEKLVDQTVDALQADAAVGTKPTVN